MNRKTAIACVLVTAAFGTTLFAGCGRFEAMPPSGDFPSSGITFDYATGETGNFQYDGIREQGFLNTQQQAASFFSLDRNTASYSQVRAQINEDQRVMADSVRIEEMINYFSYGYPAPAQGEGLMATAYLSDCPWRAEHKLLTVGMRSEEISVQSEQNNYVFLIDVSGSMSSRVRGLENESCLSLAKFGIKKLVQGLDENDTVSVVTYASGVKTVLAPTAASKAGKTKINDAVDDLRAYGSTNASGGLELAYKAAQKNYSQTGNNRVILISDGDFNVGITSQTELKEFIQEKAKSGIYLSVLGLGMGNMRDDFMQTLALNGNGNYAYIDTYEEAEKVLCEELQGMLTVVAKDAKAKVEFDENTVKEYRLIGYDMKSLTEDEFENSKTDAGEIGSNLCVTALYEVALNEEISSGAHLADVSVRFKTPADEGEREVNCSVFNTRVQNEDAEFISCVAEFGLVLRASQYKGNASLGSILSRLADMSDYLKANVYKNEFRSLVNKVSESGYYGK